MDKINEYTRSVNFLEEVLTTLMENISHITPVTNVQIVKAFSILKAAEDYEVPQKELFN